MKNILLVFLGGGVGSCLRYIISRVYNDTFENFFLGTFLVNIIGSLLIGIILGLSLRGNYLNQDQTLLLTVGFCGGFTTFSTFAFEKHSLLEAGELLHFTFYALASIAAGLVAVALGLWISRSL